MRGNTHRFGDRCGTARGSTPVHCGRSVHERQQTASTNANRDTTGPRTSDSKQPKHADHASTEVSRPVSAVMVRTKRLVGFTRACYLAGDPPLTRSKAVRAVSSAVGKVWRYFSVVAMFV